MRRELAGYLGRTRVVRTEPRHIIVTAGFALALISDTLLRLGMNELGMEDPGSPSQHRLAATTGLRVRPIPVDEQGLDVTALANSGVRAVLVTPTRQFPTCVALSAERRQALIRWAQDVDGLVIENDSDSDLWFDRRDCPPALQGLDTDRVIYAGSASTVLGSGVPMGWLVMPPHLLEELEQTRTRLDPGPDVLSQLAFAELLGSGLLDRHLRGLRSRYVARWRAVGNLVRHHLPDVTITGAVGGTHTYLRIPRQVDAAALEIQARRRSVLLLTSRHFRCGAREEGAAGVVIGYSGFSASGLAAALTAVGHAYHESGGTRAGLSTQHLPTGWVDGSFPRALSA